jgi:hypothetical protein
VDSPAVVIEIRNYRRLESGLRLLAAGGGEDVIEQALDRAIEAEPLRLREEPYPPRLPGQKYVRTFTLANSWRYDKLGPGRWLISNAATERGKQYASYVVGEETDQADIHRGRWWVGREKVESHVKKLMQAGFAASLAARYQQEIDRLTA